MEYKIKLPNDVKYIINTLEEKGYEAYAVGGCVRDSLMNNLYGNTYPKDWDITTSGKPNEIKNIFKNTVDTGIAHGTITVIINHQGYEVTTYRIDGDYIDKRHPLNVEFSNSLREDLKRRDFTINAMCYNDKTGLIDLFSGIHDMKRGILRCVGNPYKRFSEDALRMLRAIRFSSRYKLKISLFTKLAIKKLNKNLKYVSIERITSELKGILLSDFPEYIYKAFKLGLTQYFLEEYNLYHKNYKKIVNDALIISEKNFNIRLAIIFSALNEEEVSIILRKLKLDNNTIRIVKKIIKASEFDVINNKGKIREQISSIGKEEFILSIKFREAMIRAFIKNNLIDQETVDLFKEYKKISLHIISSNEPLFISDLVVDGKDLMEYNIKGVKLGDTLKYLLHLVLESPNKNNKEYLIDMAKKYNIEE